MQRRLIFDLNVSFIRGVVLYQLFSAIFASLVQFIAVPLIIFLY